MLIYRHMEKVISIRNITKIYGTGDARVIALRGVNLDIHENEFVAIMGPSGSGKSTLMNIVGLLDKQTKGVYKLDDEDVTNLDEYSLARSRNNKIGFVFQSFNLLAKMTALQNVELPMIYNGIKKKERTKRAMIALEKVGLSDRAEHIPSKMSGGQKQRVAIARALVNDPKILLADEPTGNLDSVSSEEIMEIFQNLNDSGTTILVVTHELDVANHTKRILTFKDGRLTSDKKVEEPLIAANILRHTNRKLNETFEMEE